MIGSYKVSIRSRVVNYDFEIKRKITFIRGNSGIGKTTLVDYVGRSLVNPAVKLNCNAKCYVLSGADWRLSIESRSGYIFFLDETAHFMTSAEFAKVIKKSNNYFVLVTRENLELLPYSIN